MFTKIDIEALNNIRKDTVKYDFTEEQLRSYLDIISNDLKTNGYKSKFNPLSLDYSIDENKVKDYLPIVDEEDRENVKSVLWRTRHIAIQEFDEKLNDCLNKFLDGNIDKKICIFFRQYADSFVLKSNHWVIAKCWDKIKHFRLIMHSSEIKEDEEILLLDDCLYTGIQMFQSVTLFDKHIIHVVVPYVSQQGIELINGAHLTVQRVEKVNCYYACNVDEKVDRITLNKVPIYFDHKLGDNVSTYRQIYVNILKNIPTRSYIEEMVKLFTNNYSEKSPCFK